MGSILVLNRWAPSCQGNSLLSMLTSPAEVKIIVGGPRTHHRWGGNAGSINTDACFDICMSHGSSRMISSQLGRVIGRAAFDHCW